MLFQLKFRCKDITNHLIIQIIKAKTLVIRKKKASPPSQVGLPHKLEKFHIEKIRNHFSAAKIQHFCKFSKFFGGFLE